MGIHILTSNSGFISNQIEIEFLKHYIENSNVDSHADWKLILEKFRIKQIKKKKQQAFISIEMFQSIVDPETE